MGRDSPRRLLGGGEGKGRGLTALSRFAALLLALSLCAVLAACGGSDEQAEEQPDRSEQQPAPDPEAAPPEETGGDDTDDRPEERTDPVRAAAVRWMEAIDARDGARVCALAVKGSLDDLELRPGAGCPERLEASFGRSRGAGLPQWESSRVTGVHTEETGDGEARATVSVVHELAGRETPSVEDDIVYLRRVDGRWRVAQPSATLYRAVGYPDPPLAAITPPEE